MQRQRRIDLLQLALELIDENSVPGEKAWLGVDMSRLVDLILLEPYGDQIAYMFRFVEPLVEGQYRVPQSPSLRGRHRGDVPAHGGR